MPECKRSSEEMANLTARLNKNRGNMNRREKLELVKMFVEFSDLDNHSHKDGMDHSHGHGRCRRFGKHGHGRHHGHLGPYGRQGHHHGHHGSHGHGYHGSHGDHGHHGPHGGHGHHHGRHGRHFPGLNRNSDNFKAWIIDLTQDDSESGNTSPTNQANASTSNDQLQTEDEGNNKRCNHFRFKRHHCGRFGRWSPCPFKRNNASEANANNVEKTTEAINEDSDEQSLVQVEQAVHNVDQTQENVSAMVQSINIESSV